MSSKAITTKASATKATKIPATARKSPPSPVSGGGVGGEGAVAAAATHLHIAARIDGFRRCGRTWPADGVVVPMADFSADDIERLRAEPELVVVDVVA